MTTNALRNLAATLATAGLCLLAGCSGNKGSESIGTAEGSTSPSATWDGTGSPPPSTKSTTKKKSRSEEQLAQFRKDPTPELDTLSQRSDDIKNEMTIADDTNLRMLTEDFGRFWLYERPSRMSPTAIPH